jgi:hypothetical protein
LKRWKMEALDPDQIVALARGDELAPILAPVVATAVQLGGKPLRSVSATEEARCLKHLVPVAAFPRPICW